MRSRVLIKQVIFASLSLALLLCGLYLFVWGFSTLDSIFKNAPDPNDYWPVWVWQDAQSAYNVSHFAEMLEGFAAFPAGFLMLFLSWISASCSLDVTKGEREKEERRKAEKARKILEARRAHIRSLIDEARSILESVERDPTTVANEPKLVAVRFTQSELERASEMFETEETSVDDSEQRISDLNLQAKTLAESTKLDVAEETSYSILGVSPEATRKEIMNAYREKAKIYHPDESSGWKKEGEILPEEIRQYLNAMFDKITKAKDECLRNASEGKSS